MEIKEEKLETGTSVKVKAEAKSKAKLKPKVSNIKTSKKTTNSRKETSIGKKIKSSKKTKEDQVFECRFCLKVSKGPKAKYNIRTHERRIHFPKESQSKKTSNSSNLN